MRNSKFARLLFTFIAGMGNVKRGYWPGILLYFSVMILLGAGLIIIDRKFVEPFYQLPQTGRAFVLLIFIAFIFFWDGTNLLIRGEKDLLFDRDVGAPTNKDRE